MQGKCMQTKAVQNIYRVETHMQCENNLRYETWEGTSLEHAELCATTKMHIKHWQMAKVVQKHK